MANERRRDRRYPFVLSVVLGAGRGELPARVEDVSFRGIRLRTDARLSERQLVRLRLSVPPQGEELATTGMVIRLLPADDAGVAGAGIQFYALSVEQRERWNRFIRFVALGAPEKDPPVVVPAELPANVTPRRHPRYAAALQVHLRTVDELHEVFTVNVSKGGMFVGTRLALPIGAAVRLGIFHPTTSEQYHLDAVVRWQSRGNVPGLGLEFTNLTDERREEFLSFIRSEIPVEQVVYVADPARGDSGTNGG